MTFARFPKPAPALWRGKFSNDAAGIGAFLAQLQARGWPLRQIHFALEATGVYGKQLVAALHQAGVAVIESVFLELIAADESLSRQSKLLCSIPGIAQLTAAKLLAELAGKEFQSARQLAAYAGLTPAECRSGFSRYGKTVLCKIGNAFLRKALYLPAAVARRWCKPIRQWAAELESRKLHSLAIRGAIMRKLLHIVFGVLRHQQPYNPRLAAILK